MSNFMLSLVYGVERSVLQLFKLVDAQVNLLAELSNNGSVLCGLLTLLDFGDKPKHEHTLYFEIVLRRRFLKPKISLTFDFVEFLKKTFLYMPCLSIADLVSEQGYPGVGSKGSLTGELLWYWLISRLS
jgi:hypothetical protein